MFSVILSIGFRTWKAVIGVFTLIGCVLTFVLNWTMFPQKNTHKPNTLAIAAWLIANAGLFVWCAFFFHSRAQLYIAAALAVLHFLIVVTALLVITEENDVWSGYIRHDRDGGKDERAFKQGRIVKSLPLILISGVFYLADSAIVVKAWHSQNAIFTTRFSPNISIAHYIATVSGQIPIFDTLLKWSGVRVGLEFQGMAGTAIKLVMYLTNVSIIVGTFNSYFRQKSELRRLVEALGSETGNIPALQAQASRAPEEIKSAMLKMALHDPQARMRWRAMTVAQYANTLTFPATMVYNLHKETRERNKQHALDVAMHIVRNNLGHVNADYLMGLDRKIEFQLQGQRRHHSQKTLGMLVDLRRLLQPSGWMNAAE